MRKIGFTEREREGLIKQNIERLVRLETKLQFVRSILKKLGYEAQVPRSPDQGEGGHGSAVR